VKKAVEDARISKEDIELVIYSVYGEVMLKQQIPQTYIHGLIGMGGKPSYSIKAGGATDGYALFAAYCHIASGMNDLVMLLGTQKSGDLYSHETRSRGDGFLKGGALGFDVTWQMPVSPGGVPALLTVSCLVPHMQQFGGPTEEQIAKVSVKNHRNALLNPLAQLKMDLSVEDVMNSRIIAWPTTMYECCLYSDCSSALILASEEKAKEITDRPIWITGIGLANHHQPRLEIESLGRMKGLELAAQRAYQMAGIKNPMKELDVIELHDFISGVEVMAYEELGLCPLGEGGRLVDEGVVEKNGSLPVNPSGGRVACGHAPGVSGVSSTGEIVLQLQERAGERQVAIKNGRGLVGCIDGDATTNCVAILERKD
jgi:acetyl-CoA acetyltransferase